MDWKKKKAEVKLTRFIRSDLYSANVHASHPKQTRAPQRRCRLIHSANEAPDNKDVLNWEDNLLRSGGCEVERK